MSSSTSVDTAVIGKIKDTFRAILEESLKLRKSDDIEEKDALEFYQQAALQLARLKMHSRSIHLSIDGERKKLDGRKTVIDQLQLSSENLLYQKAHVQREIDKCKELPTPNLDAVQSERGNEVGTTVYSEHLAEIHAQALDVLREEKGSRIEMKGQLAKLEVDNTTAIAELSRKRKVIEALPDQVAKIRAASKEVSDDLTSMVTEIQLRRKVLMPSTVDEEDTAKAGGAEEQVAESAMEVVEA